MYRRAVFETITGFNPGLSVAADYDLYLHVLREFPSENGLSRYEVPLERIHIWTTWSAQTPLPIFARRSAPLLVFASYFIGSERMNLEFTIPEIVAVIVAIGIVGQISGDGESNWLEGVQLLSVYAVLAILFYFLPEVASHAANGKPAHP